MPRLRTNTIKGVDVTLGEWLSLIGLAVALAQIWRLGRITRATKKAVEEATGRVSLYNFLLVVPELTRLESDIEAAALADDPELLRRHLKEWREAMGELHGVLSNEGLSGQKIEQLISDSLVNVTLAKSNVVEGKSTDLLTATKKARKAIEDVCIETKRMASSVRSSAAASGLLLPTPAADAPGSSASPLPRKRLSGGQGG